MQRRLVIFFMLLCMGWQSLTHAGVDALLSEGQARVHALLHFGGTAHHHHRDAYALHAHDHADDNGFHLDGSPASVKHMMQDTSLCQPVLLMETPLAAHLTARPPPPAEATLNEPPRPYLSGLDRPPKPLA